MSWDVLICNATSAPPPAEQMPNDWKGDPLGSADEVRARISKVLPSVNWSDPTWGVYDGDGFSFEFSISTEAQIDGFVVHVRGSGDAVSDLLKLGEVNGWYLYDCSQDEWLHHCADTRAGWEGFQAFRDRAIGQ